MTRNSWFPGTEHHKNETSEKDVRIYPSLELIYTYGWFFLDPITISIKKKQGADLSY